MIRQIHLLDRDHEYFTYFDRSPDAQLAGSLSNVRVLGTRRSDLLWANLDVPAQLQRDRIDVFITFLDKEIPFLTGRCKVVSMVHDLIPLRFPRVVFRNALHSAYYRGLMWASVRRCDGIMTNSEYSMREILAEYALKEQKVRKITLGVSAAEQEANANRDEVLQRFGATRPYLLAVGGTEPRKNNERVIEAFRLLQAQRPELQLVIVGKEWRGRRFSSQSLRDGVILTGQISDAEMDVLFRAAEMLVFPSLHEGFGFPILEAMLRGVPVVTSRLTALPEVGGNAALYVDPYSVREIADAVAQLLGDSRLTAMMRTRGYVRASLFRWEATCKEIAHFCSDLLGER